MSEKNGGPFHPRRRLIVALGAAAVVLVAVVVSAALVLPGRQAPQAVENVGEPLTPQEIAEVKAAVEKQTGMPVRYVWRNRDGVVEVFGEPGRASYRVKKTEEGWKVIEKFYAFFA